MNPHPAQIAIEPDAFHVARESIALVATLQAAIAVCAHDDTQGVGGMLHLRYLTNGDNKPLDLTDNTLSTDLLLLDRFCKELRSQGARKQSWRIRLVGHVPMSEGAQTPVATLLDLLRAYFADSRIATEYKEVKSEASVIVRMDAREGDLGLAKSP
jgi:chemotaxis receptor (MCP) glutamine deamidase CheD